MYLKLLIKLEKVASFLYYRIAFELEKELQKAMLKQIIEQEKTSKERG